MPAPLPRLHFEPVLAEDFEFLAALREAALRESLERLGLFSRERSRERLRSNFRPEFMRHIVCDGQRVGLLTLWPEGDALKLQHLYLAPGSQGKGIGAWVLEQVKAEASAQGRDVKLEALPQSDANRFYLRHGFVKVGESEVDVFYIWRVQPGAGCNQTQAWKLSGSIPYFLTLLRELPRLRGWDMQLQWDNADSSPQQAQGEMLLCSLLNTPTYGSGYPIAPMAKMDDGVLQLLIARRVGRWKFLDMFSKCCRANT